MLMHGEVRVVAFKEVLNFLYDRALENDPEITNQDDFAKRHGVERETINQWLTGNLIPPGKTIWEIIEREHYTLDECVQLPEAERTHGEHRELFRSLESILLSKDDDRIHGIRINLLDIAVRAREEKRKRDRSKKAHKEGNLIRGVKKKELG